MQDKRVIEDFYNQIVSGLTKDTLLDFLEDNKDNIKKFELSSEEVVLFVRKLHINRCNKVGGVGVNPYTNVPPDFFCEETENIIEEHAPKLLTAYSLINYYRSNYTSMFQILTQLVNNNAKQYITEQIREKTSEIVSYTENKSKELASNILNKTDTKINEISNKAVEESKQAVNTAAKEIEDNLKTQADNKVKDAANKIENNLTRKTAETSVTILGIFAAIVLTVVGGFIYSASVLNNINKTSEIKLFFIASTVGFICVSMLTVMFHYIYKFKYGNDEVSFTKINGKFPKKVLIFVWRKIKNNLFVSLILTILFLCMVGGFIACCGSGSNNSQDNQTESSNSAIKDDLNGSYIINGTFDIQEPTAKVDETTTTQEENEPAATIPTTPTVQVRDIEVVN